MHVDDLYPIYIVVLALCRWVGRWANYVQLVGEEKGIAIVVSFLVW